MHANIQVITLNINDLNTPSKKIGSDWETQFNLPRKQKEVKTATWIKGAPETKNSIGFLFIL